ncbi:hypothetical protein B0H19DRAFT_1385153 [Mycena capillaripes]|nr:hypothetical protein B0H19DRAFT_1385153 [Mycena capillaripes]
MEYKKSGNAEGKALNHVRMYLVSVISFYSPLVSPTFGFTAWLLDLPSNYIDAFLHHKSTYHPDLLDIVNIASPLQAFHFATFLFLLRETQDELTQRVKTTFVKGVLPEKFSEWGKLVQVADAKKAALANRGSWSETIVRLGRCLAAASSTAIQQVLSLAPPVLQGSSSFRF